MALLLAAMLAAATASAQQTGPIGVEADNLGHDDQRDATHLEGNVRISRGSLVVRADEGFAYRGSNGYERIELFGQPVEWQTITEDGGETTGQADELVYNLLDRTVTLIGNARLQDSRGTFSGDRLVYNLVTQSPEGQGNIRLSIEPEVLDDSESSDEPQGDPDTTTTSDGGETTPPDSD